MTRLSRNVFDVKYGSKMKAKGNRIFFLHIFIRSTAHSQILNEREKRKNKREWKRKEEKERRKEMRKRKEKKEREKKNKKKYEK